MADQHIIFLHFNDHWDLKHRISFNMQFKVNNILFLRCPIIQSDHARSLRFPLLWPLLLPPLTSPSAATTMPTASPPALRPPTSSLVPVGLPTASLSNLSPRASTPAPAMLAHRLSWRCTPLLAAPMSHCTANTTSPAILNASRWMQHSWAMRLFVSNGIIVSKMLFKCIYFSNKSTKLKVLCTLRHDEDICQVHSDCGGRCGSLHNVNVELVYWLE